MKTALLKSFGVLFIFTAASFSIPKQVDSGAHQKGKEAPIRSDSVQVVMQHLKRVADMHNERDALSIAGTLGEGCAIVQIDADGARVASNTVNCEEYAVLLGDYFRNKPGYAYRFYPLEIQAEGSGFTVQMDVVESWEADGTSVGSSSRQTIRFVPDASGRLLAQTITYQRTTAPQPKADNAVEGNVLPK